MEPNRPIRTLRPGDYALLTSLQELSGLEDGDLLIEYVSLIHPYQKVEIAHAPRLWECPTTKKSLQVIGIIAPDTKGKKRSYTIPAALLVFAANYTNAPH
jgi:hypothetical protein